MTGGAPWRRDADGGPWTLSGTLERLEQPLAPLLGEGLAPRRVMQVARLLPAGLGNCVFFERWLGAGAPRVDLIVLVRDYGRAQLASAAGEGLPGHLRGRPEWQRVGSFAREWAAQDSELRHLVEGVWLEFDLDAPHADRLEVPRLFVDFARERRRGAPAGQRLADTLAVLRPLGRELDPAAHARLRHGFERQPASVGLLYLGLRLDADDAPLRLCLQGPRRDLVGWLRAVGWPGDVGDLAAQVLEPFDRARGEDPSAASILHVDVGAELAPKIGLEYVFARAGQARGRLAEVAFLDHLVERGWCPEQERSALAAWPGRSLVQLPHEVWRSQVTRRLSHVKVAYATGQPVELKAYACFFHRLAPGGVLAADLATSSRARRRHPAPPAAPERALPLRDRVPAPSQGTAVDRADANRRLAPSAPPAMVGRRRGTGLAPSRAVTLGGSTMSLSTAGKNALEKILEKAAQDREFRRGLLEDPRTVIQEAFGVRIPRDFRVKFIEKTPDIDALVVLPDCEDPDGVLDDRDLEHVAGGDGTPPDTNWADGIDG